MRVRDVAFGALVPGRVPCQHAPLIRSPCTALLRGTTTSTTTAMIVMIVIMGASPQAINAALLDSYLLKSLDGFTSAFVADEAAIVKCGPGLRKVCLFGGLTEHPPITQGGGPRHSVLVGRISPGDPVAQGLHKMLDDAGHVLLTQEAQSRALVSLSGATDEEGEGVVVSGALDTAASEFRVSTEAFKNETLVNAIAEIARRGGTPHPMVYDKVVRCLGWKHGLGVYTSRTAPTMQHNGKYAVMTHEYEAANVPGLYYAGTLSHGKDHQRSAGGFIHGFRCAHDVNSPAWCRPCDLLPMATTSTCSPARARACIVPAASPRL